MLNRRQFFQRGAFAAAALALPERLLRDPYAPLISRAFPGAPVRVTGRVHANGTGIGRVAVSDGASVALTDISGRYTLIADSSRPFVFVSLPSGYRLPVSRVGTVSFHQRIVPGRGDMRADFAIERLAEGDSSHAFLVLADTQTQNAFEMGRLHSETVPDVRATIASLGALPAFGVACGDIMFDDLTLFPGYERAVSAMGIPFFQVVGNHDIVFDARTDEGSAAVFEQHFGPTYYSFNRGEIHYVVLDDVFWHGQGYLGYLDQTQQHWLAADLAHVEAGRTVVVLLHIPALSTRAVRDGGRGPEVGESVANREALYRLLAPYRAYVMSGHTHEHERHTDGSVQHHVHGTVCGAWWSGDICWDGTPNGYAVYEARGSELRWRYKSTGQPVEMQMRLYKPGSDPTAPKDLVANVWDADDSWTVVWCENGERRGLMSRRLGLDPRSVEEHTGPEKPPRRQWVEPTRTNHLYYAPISSNVTDIRVEATDQWGRKYVASA